MNKIIDGQRVFIETNRFQRRVEIDVRTRDVGGSAAVVFADEKTEVVFGGLYAQVLFKDLGVEVTMDPYEGEWKSPGWARAQAMEVITHPRVVALLLPALTELHFEIGRREGAEAVRREFRKIIGINELIGTDR